MTERLSECVVGDEVCSKGGICIIGTNWLARAFLRSNLAAQDCKLLANDRLEFEDSLS